MFKLNSKPKRLIFILILTLLVSAFSVAVFTIFANFNKSVNQSTKADGDLEFGYNITSALTASSSTYTNNNVFYIASRSSYATEGFKIFAQSVNNGCTFSGKTVYLGGDIDFNNAEITAITGTFSGTFDGQFYMISNFKMNSLGYQWGNENGGNYGPAIQLASLSLFCHTSGATIKNLHVNNGYYCFKGETEWYDPDGICFISGGLVGYSDVSTTIKECIVDKCSVYIKYSNGAFEVKTPGGSDLNQMYNFCYICGIVGLGKFNISDCSTNFYPTNFFTDLNNSGKNIVNTFTGGYYGDDRGKDLAVNEKYTIGPCSTITVENITYQSSGSVKNCFSSNSSATWSGNVVRYPSTIASSNVTISNCITSANDTTTMGNMSCSTIGGTYDSSVPGRNTTWYYYSGYNNGYPVLRKFMNTVSDWTDADFYCNDTDYSNFSYRIYDVTFNKSINNSAKRRFYLYFPNSLTLINSSNLELKRDNANNYTYIEYYGVQLRFYDYNNLVLSEISGPTRYQYKFEYARAPRVLFGIYYADTDPNTYNATNTKEIVNDKVFNGTSYSMPSDYGVGKTEELTNYYGFTSTYTLQGYENNYTSTPNWTSGNQTQTSNVGETTYWYAVWQGDFIISETTTYSTPTKQGNSIYVYFWTDTSAKITYEAYIQTRIEFVAKEGYFDQYHRCNFLNHSGNKTTKTTSTTYYRLATNINGTTTYSEWSKTKPNLSLETVFPTATKTGYTFEGWSYSQNSTSKSFSAGNNFIATSTTNYYAVWKNKPTRWNEGTLTHQFYDTRVRSGDPNSTVTTNIYYTNATVYYNYNLTKQARSTKAGEQGSINYDALPFRKPSNINGYTFVGWTSNSTNTTAEWTSGSRQVNSNTTWYSVWELNIYRLTYDLAGGTFENTEIPAGAELKNDGTNPYVEFTIESNLFDLLIPTRKWYICDYYKVSKLEKGKSTDTGYSINKSTSGTYAVNDEISQINIGSYGNITVTMNWKVKEYTLKFENLSIISANDVIPTASKTEGTTVNINAVNNVISFKINSFTKISFIRTFKTNDNPSNIYQYKFEVCSDQDKTNLLRTFVVTYTLGNNYNDLLWKYELNNSASCFSLEAVNNTLYEDVSTYSLTDDNGAEYVVNPISSLKQYNIT